ncbi:MAG: hypothetical protein U9P79_07435 [Candidatus Cloacimonadota bacterium]|nr:hypothetical protein [Candidatus Cloacimonadota bacterium]
MNGKIWIIIVSVFLFILSSNLTKFVYLSKQCQIEQLKSEIWNTREALNDLKNDISKLSMDKRIVFLARTELGMIFPSSRDIICVIQNETEDKINKYSFRNFLSPNVMASENH